jgi:ribosome biogenesis GTPase
VNLLKVGKLTLESNIKKGKIIKILGGFYYIHNGDTIIECRARGNFRKEKIKPLVGDYADFRVPKDKEHLGYIEKIYDRKNSLIRPPVSNIDQSIVVFAVKDPNPNYIILDKFLINSLKENINPVICINKIDLDEDKAKEIGEYYKNSGFKVILTSKHRDETVESLREVLRGKTSVFAGPSGTGKSSLLNTVKPGLNLKIGEISQKLKRGKHTTRHVEMIEIFSDSWVVDTAGFSSLDIKDIDKYNLKEYYYEFNDYYCKFNDCLHYKEPGCEVRKAVEAGDISDLRYKNYLKIFSEIQEGDYK